MVSNHARKRILFVDPDGALRDKVRGALEGAGYDVQVATDGLEALLRIEDAPPSLIVIELLVPQLDGLRLLRNLRERPETRDIPFIVATACDDPATLIDVGALCAGAYLAKPYSPNELLARIGRVLPS